MTNLFEEHKLYLEKNLFEQWSSQGSLIVCLLNTDNYLKPIGAFEKPQPQPIIRKTYTSDLYSINNSNITFQT